MERLSVGVGLALSVLLAGVAEAQQPTAEPKEEHVRGDVVALKGNDLQVMSPGGKKVALELTDDARIAVASKADLSSLGQGVFIGTTAVPQSDGTLRAIEVHVFPESMRGSGEGHRPWDLRPGSSMTNATVSKVQSAKGKPPSTMTNATVAQVANEGGALKLVLEYPAGQKTVIVPPGTPVVQLAPGDRSRVVPGAHVFAARARQPDGTIRIQRMVVGEGGVRPPM